MTAASDRLELSRLVHRFGLGPKPGEYLQLLAGGIPQARAKILSRRSDPGLNALVTPPFPNMGQVPSDPTASAAYWTEVWDQSLTVAIWWMDRMVLADSPFIERMTWFWHGHCDVDQQGSIRAGDEDSKRNAAHARAGKLQGHVASDGERLRAPVSYTHLTLPT